MLSLLAFTLAFTFALAATHLDARHAIMAGEANATRTTHLLRLLISPLGL
jgi:hypothetical protein